MVRRDQVDAKKSRRGRGTRARLRAERSEGIRTDAVRGGLPGGSFRPLSDRDMERIHSTALDVLEEIGMGDPIPDIIDAAVPRGAILTGGGRLCFPRSLIEDLIAASAKEFTHYAPNPAHDIEIGGDRVHFRTCGEAVNIFDYEKREFRPSTLVDLYDTVRLADQLPNVHAFCQTVVATEHSGDAFVHDINVVYAQLAGTQKALAGALVQTFAESLAAVAVMNLISPGTPIFMGVWPFISDLRTGSFTGGSGEQALVSAAISQLCNFYGLPSSSSACMTDAKLPDAQSGFEKGVTSALVAMAGCNYIGETAGMLGSLMACSFEGMVIDDDMIGSVMRAVRGIEVTDETLSLQVIRDTVEGSGHYLDHEQTLELMQTEYVYPQVADRSNYDDWKESGKRDLHEVAHERVKKLLANYYPDYIDPVADAKIREHFPIMLKPEDMKPGNGRW